MCGLIYTVAVLQGFLDHIFLDMVLLKRHNQVEIIKKSVFLFWHLNMAIRCDHVHRLKLQKSL